MRIAPVKLCIVTCLSFCGLAGAWDNEELEVFDVVEEVNRNFYELMGIEQNANSSDIRKAFRRLSLQLHPDKNNADDAEIQFRNLVAVYDVLKDPAKRERYNNVLINGLPNWRSAVYYYRHVRKMGLLEMSVILFIVITVGQYLVAWAAYLEKRYTYEQVLGSKLQKMQKKNRKGKMGDVPDLAEILETIPCPSVRNTLPFQLPRWTYASIVGIPSMVRAIGHILEERKRRKKEEEQTLAVDQEESESEPVARLPRRRRAGFTPQENSTERSNGATRREFASRNNPTYERPKVVGSLWTDDDILELVRLVNKYPGGTAERWEKIAEAMGRTVSEVTHMAKKVKEDGLKPGQPNESEFPTDERPKKVKTRAESLDECSNALDWTQEQQRALESALLKHPKGASVDRWEKIANCIEGKTKEECQNRYRQLVDLVKKRHQSH